MFCRWMGMSILVALLAVLPVASSAEFLGLDANGNLACDPTDMLLNAAAGDVGTTKSIRVFFEDVPAGVFGHGCTFCVTDKSKVGTALFTYTSPSGWNNGTVFASDTSFHIPISDFITHRYPNYKCWAINAFDFAFTNPIPANTPYALGTLQYQVADEGCIQWVLDGPYSVVQTTGFATLYFEGPGETCDTVPCTGLLRIDTSIPTCPILDGTAGMTYPPGTVFTATGGTPPYTWGQLGLPQGMNINPSNGEIVGMPMESGEFFFTVSVDDAMARHDERACSLTVAVAGPLVIDRVTPACPIPNGTKGFPYPSGTVFTATGGIPPYTWGQSGLPQGMFINSTTGEVMGTPMEPGIFEFTITVDDPEARHDERPCSLFVRTPRAWRIFPDGSGDQPTIQAGLNAALYGDTVLAAEGIYHETLFWPFRNGIILLGSGMDSTIVVGDQVQTVLYVVGNALFEKGAGEASKAFADEHPEILDFLRLAVPIDSTTVIRGLRFRNGGDAGAVFYGSSPTLDSCAVDSTRNGRGIHCLSGSAARIHQCLIVNNLGSGIEITACDSLLAVTDNRVTGNSGSSGGGIYCYYSSPEISNNTITVNSASGSGGGISCYHSSPDVSDNTITGNVSTLSGGGIYCGYSSSPEISDNIIMDNSAGDGGGGIAVSSGSAPSITGNEIVGNFATGNGGGARCLSSSPEFMGNMISRNTATSTGGGIYCSSASATISANTIKENAASFGGGGIAFHDGSVAAITNNMIAGNHDWGILCDRSSPSIAGNTVTRNSRPEQNAGGGIGCDYSSSPDIIANWIVGNPGNGVYCYQSSPRILDNVIAENGRYDPGGGVFCWGSSSPTITGNSIVRNAVPGNGGGIYCTVNSFPMVSLNTVTENSAGGLGDGIYTEGSSPTVSNCNLAYNGWGHYNASYSLVPLSQNNWWGHSSGPWHSGANPAGQGDSLSIYAWDFIPWLGEPNRAAPPIPPRHLEATSQPDGSLLLAWAPVPLGDLAGYRVHLDTDTLGWPYADSVDVGNVTTCALDGLQSGTTYYMAVTCYDNDGNRSWYSAPDSAVAEVSTGVETASVPTAYRLGPNVPNPFNPTTAIGFAIPAPGPVALTIHDITGRRVATIAEGVYQPGEFTAVWNGKDDAGAHAPSGIYFARLRAGDFEATRKLVLIR